MEDDRHDHGIAIPFNSHFSQAEIDPDRLYYKPARERVN
jgi:hypothetical protein